MMNHGKNEEIEIITKILAFEELTLNECQNLLLKYQDAITEVDIELKAQLVQQRGLYGARVKPYDLRQEQKLPRFYSSKIVCSAFRDGKLLTKQEDYDKRVTSLFVMIFPLIRAWKKEVELTQNPLSAFETQINGLFERIEKSLT